MTWSAQDRWTCPVCQRTVVVHGSQDDTHEALVAVQTRHYREHRQAARLDAQLRRKRAG